MYLQTIIHVPEAVTGLIGAALIGISLWASIRYNRLEETSSAEADQAVAAE
jgi:hypothetical protein